MISAKSIVLTRRFGLRSMCYTSLIVQLVIIGLFSWVLHPALLILVLLRSVSRSLVTAPINAEVTPRIDKEQRATYLSMQSLLSRLSFALLLLFLGLGISLDATDNWMTVSAIFRWSFISGIIISIPILFMNSGQLFKRAVAK